MPLVLLLTNPNPKRASYLTFAVTIHFADPLHFRLPHFDTVLNSRGHTDTFFVKIDVANFYWSLLLPATVLGYFTMSSGVAGDVTYGTRRLPFGWKWSPIIAQDTLASILQLVAAWFCDSFWQYLDDILLACRDPYFFAICAAICQLAHCQGWTVHQRNVI